MTASTALEGRTRRAGAQAAMGLPMAVGLVLVGLFSFAAIVLLSGYADDLRTEPEPMGGATDRSAVGFAGLQVLLREFGHEVRVDPYPAQGQWNGRDLRIYVPTRTPSDSQLERLDTNVPGLVVLPKWSVSRLRQGADPVARTSDPGVSGRGARILDALEPGHELHAHRRVQHDWAVSGLPMAENLTYPITIAHATSEPDMPAEPSDAAEAEPQDERELTEEEREALEALEELVGTFGSTAGLSWKAGEPERARDAVLHPLDSYNVLVLSDADLLNNHGIATESRARVAVALLEQVAAAFDIADPVFVFDDNLHRRDTSQNLVKLLTRPPFLAATLCLLAAGALVAWQGFNRFGAPRDEADDAPARGPRALAETAGVFITEAGRADGLAPGYAEVVRRQVLERLGLNVWDRARAGAALAARERARDIQPTFEHIETMALAPMERVRMLQRWKQEITR